MGETVVGAFRQVFGFLVQGIDFAADGRAAFESELRELVAPHMAVLAHRRAKLLDDAGEARWSDELDAFMSRNLWPLLGEFRDYATRNRTFVTLLLDVAIAEAQRVAAAPRAEIIPLVSRFDATWAS
ncbi:MAG TPA: hypothetical protein VNU97_15075 [Rhizomicrobium sp.]|jgi:hypothetical protein|nr:hypothetical protein [Rhizomicrobium sp.]